MMDNPGHRRNEDAGLIESAAAGDAEAFRKIVEEHQAMVYRTCLRILNNETEAKEATQATFIVCHRKCRNLKPGTVLGGWLYKAASLVSREYLRSTVRRRGREAEAGAINELIENEGAEVWAAMKPELDRALSALPAKYRDVIVLRYFEEKSNQETAEALGLSSSAVSTRLSRALEHLRVSFQRLGIATSTAALSAVLAGKVSAASVPMDLAAVVLRVAGPGAMASATSASVASMAKGALTQMGSVLWYAFEFLIFFAWCLCLMDWIKEGCRIPLWVHVLAGCLLVSGV